MSCTGFFIAKKLCDFGFLTSLSIDAQLSGMYLGYRTEEVHLQGGSMGKTRHSETAGHFRRRLGLSNHKKVVETFLE